MAPIIWGQTIQKAPTETESTSQTKTETMHILLFSSKCHDSQIQGTVLRKPSDVEVAWM